jgi:hypothetical protein
MISDAGSMFVLRLAMIQSDPPTMSVTIRTPKASAIVTPDGRIQRCARLVVARFLFCAPTTRPSSPPTSPTIRRTARKI